jgi:hypothetical protein
MSTKFRRVFNCWQSNNSQYIIFVFMIHLRAKFYIPGSSTLFVIPIKSKAKKIFTRTPVVTLPYVISSPWIK